MCETNIRVLMANQLLKTQRESKCEAIDYHKTVCKLPISTGQSTITTKEFCYENTQLIQLAEIKSKQADIDIFASPTGAGRSFMLSSLIEEYIAQNIGAKQEPHKCCRLTK
jgi:hypothetical protein